MTDYSNNYELFEFLADIQSKQEEIIEALEKRQLNEDDIKSNCQEILDAINLVIRLVSE